MSSYPPDGWRNTVGTWGTDLDVNASVVLSGIYSILMESGSVCQLQSDLFPVVEGQPYRLKSALRTEDTLAGPLSAGDLYVGVDWYQSDGTTSISTSVYNVASTVADTWFYPGLYAIAPSAARYAKVYAGKDADASSDTYIDHLLLTEAAPFILVQKNGTDQTTIAADGTYTAVTFTSELSDLCGLWNGTSTFTAKRHGLWLFESSITTVTNITADKYCALQFYKNSVAFSYDDKYSTGSHVMSLRATSGLVELNPGDTMQLKIASDNGGTFDIDGPNDITWLRAIEVG